MTNKIMPINSTILIEPYKEGLIATSDANVYTILQSSLYKAGSLVVVEEQNVINVLVDGKRTFFVKEEYVLAIITNSEVDVSPDGSAFTINAGDPGPDLSMPSDPGASGV